MRGELASEQVELSTRISRLLLWNGVISLLLLASSFPLDLRLSMIYVGTVSINKRGVHDVKLETRQWQTALANAIVM